MHPGETDLDGDGLTTERALFRPKETLSALKRLPLYRRQVVHTRIIPPRAPKHASLTTEPALPSAVTNTFAALGTWMHALVHLHPLFFFFFFFFCAHAVALLTAARCCGPRARQRQRAGPILFAPSRRNRCRTPGRAPDPKHGDIVGEITCLQYSRRVFIFRVPYSACSVLNDWTGHMFIRRLFELCM